MHFTSWTTILWLIEVHIDETAATNLWEKKSGLDIYLYILYVPVVGITVHTTTNHIICIIYTVKKLRKKPSVYFDNAVFKERSAWQ